MTAADLLVDGFGRIREVVHQVVDGLEPEQLGFRVDSRANSIAWLVWHLTRVQHDHVADAAGTEQVWTAGGWVERFGLPFHPLATGYGHRAAEVAAVRASGELLVGYHDESWDPPVSLGVRLVSVVADDLQHAGQAAFVRGVVERR
jgi:hypothetical protein